MGHPIRLLYLAHIIFRPLKHEDMTWWLFMFSMFPILSEQSDIRQQACLSWETTGNNKIPQLTLACSMGILRKNMYCKM